jgi:Domain of unknown function (DUF4345)
VTRAFLWATACVFFGFGLWGLVSPFAMVAIFGIDPGGPNGLTMIRASYGGFLIGEGLLFGWCAMAEARHRFGLLAVVLLTLPILVARIIGIAIDGATSPLHFSYVGIELLGIVLALILLRRA